MRNLSIAFALLLTAFGQALFAQQTLPRWTTPEEMHLMDAYRESRAEASRGITTPPNFALRTMAEWEEIDYLCITWTSYPAILAEIVREAQSECTVIIVCTDSNTVKNSLTNTYNVPLNKVRFLQRAFDSIWMRDYGANSMYMGEVDSLFLVDWIYNRPRPNDDAVPDGIASMLGLQLYSTSTAPYDLVHTGGNFMADGFGTAFSSKLVEMENSASGNYNTTVRTAYGVDTMMQKYMDIDPYAKMTVLPYDGIHHIDMHMKLLDEETLLWSEYPSGVADGPQIEANLLYISSNFTSVYGTPYKIVRVLSPPDASGKYPGPGWNAGDYLTYSNMTFVNKKVLLPLYQEKYDTTALRILRQAMPGYEIVGINCNAIIPLGGAIHCITHSVGSSNPLLISHQALPNTTNTTVDYTVDATIKHRSGISGATLYWTTDTTQGWTSVAMSNTTADTWSADIPAQNMGTHVSYYIHATANSGKTQVRPMPAPAGFWTFYVGILAGQEELLTQGIDLGNVFPNPASAITAIPVTTEKPLQGQLRLLDLLGRELQMIHQGTFPPGKSHYFIHADQLPAGTYLIQLQTEKGTQTQKLNVQ
ncbi:MAG: agmatine deiminase family protein [Bacteroidia bacterium]|nr:agmatine deiminase family protein [Bacteroidia bacterium]